MAAVIKAFISLFIIMDPIGNIPVFLAVTDSLERDQQKKAFTLSAIIAFFILLFFGVCGQYILEQVFHIKIADLLIAGGILLFLVAVQNLLWNPYKSLPNTQQISDPKEVACVPLACPLLAGPGAMVTMLTIWHSPEAGAKVAMLALTMVLLWFWFQMRIVHTINRFLGKLIITAFSKVMLIFVAAIGTKMTIQGILHYFPAG